MQEVHFGDLWSQINYQPVFALVAVHRNYWSTIISFSVVLVVVLVLLVLLVLHLCRYFIKNAHLVHLRACGTHFNLLSPALTLLQQISNRLTS